MKQMVDVGILIEKRRAKDKRYYYRHREKLIAKKLKHYHNALKTTEYKKKKSIYDREYKSRPDVILKKTERMKSYRKRKYVIEKRREECKKYSKTQLFKESQRRYSQTKKGKNMRRLQVKRFQSTKRGKMCLKKNNYLRYSRLKCIIHDFLFSEWKKKIDAAENVCVVCGCVSNLTMDHIYPVSVAYRDYLKTGIMRVYTIDDVVPMCLKCNSKKNARLINVKE
jgi:hypothetical protein